MHRVLSEIQTEVLYVSLVIIDLPAVNAFLTTNTDNRVCLACRHELIPLTKTINKPMG